MCNLYRITTNAAEIARLFAAADFANTPNVGDEVYPGYPGVVIADGELRSMTWGFPLAMKGKAGEALKQQPVNNARADKLDRFFWRYSFEKRRCLIPVEQFAETEGAKGTKTRTWIGLPDTPVFAVAGVWRVSDEWGPVYSMVMTEACVDMAGIDDRMPVILAPEDHKQWCGETLADARALCRPYRGVLAIDRTDEPWSKRRSGHAERG